MSDHDSLLMAEDVGRRGGGGDWLLRGITLDVRAGERGAVSGPTGSGKTLLLRSLALLDPLDEGRILFRSRTVARDAVPAMRREAVYVHQRPALMEGTVDENLRLPFTFRSARGTRFDRPWAVAELDRLGRSERFLERSSQDLSGGERQMVALLRAIQLRPCVLLLDEPTAALDRQSVAAIEELVDRWHHDAPAERAVVWVSHDPAQLDRVADRVLRLENGRVVE